MCEYNMKNKFGLTKKNINEIAEKGAKVFLENSYSYFQFREKNYWEHEVWNFYLKLNIFEHKKLKNIVNKMNEICVKNSKHIQYTLEDNIIDEKEVDKRCDSNAGGYMAFHNKVEHPIIPKLPKKINWEWDPFYKGSQWEKVKNE